MKSLYACALAAIGLALAGPAFATVSVRMDENTLMDLRAPAGTVLIGNPAVVDVSLLGPRRIAILGRGYGATNVIITDRMGRVIFREEIQVSRPAGDNVSVYRGVQASNFICAPNCQRAADHGQAGAAPAAASAGAAGQAQPPPPPQ